MNDKTLERPAPVKSTESERLPPVATRRLTIDELQKILKRDDETPIQIMPNGEIRQGDEPTTKKILTFRENLGGEYAS